MHALDQMKRLLVLDEALSRPPFLKKAEILERYAEQHLPYSKNTFDRDLKALREDFGAEIVIDKVYRYSYAGEGFVVLKQFIADHAAVGKAVALAVLNARSPQVSLPFIEVLQAISEAEEGRLHTPAEELEGVLLDDSRYLALSKLRAQLLGAIQAKAQVYLRYIKFGSRREFGLRFHPYVLKEYLGRWYVLGNKMQGSRMQRRVYGLERITHCEVLEEVAVWPDDDPASYFDDIVGVSKPAHQQREEIIIAADRKMADYLLTQPWHLSQKILDREGEWTRISFQLVPNAELEQLLLSMGPAVRVLKPATFRARIKGLLEEALERYG